MLTDKYGFSPSCGAIEALAMNNNRITLIYLSDFSEEDLKVKSKMSELCRDVILIKRKRYNGLSHRILRINCFLKKAFIEEHKHFSSEMRARLQELDRPDKFDIAVYDNFYLVQYADCIHRLPKTLYLMDSMTLRAEEMLKSATLGFFNRLELSRFLNKTRDFEKDRYGSFAEIIVVAKKDREAIHRLNPESDIAVLPLVVDTEYFKKRFPEDENKLIFPAVLWAEHNVDAAYYFCSEIFPLIQKRNREVDLLLVGGKSRREIRKFAMNNPRIKLLGFVEDVRPYLDKAAVFVSPMRTGSGMNNKLLEAMAMSKAIVTTAHGNREIDLKNGFEGFVCNDKYEFADAVSGLLKDKEKRDLLGANARKKAEREFSREVYSQKLQALIEEIVSRWNGGHGTG